MSGDECNHCWDANGDGIRCCVFCGVTDERDRTEKVVNAQVEEFERSTGDGAYEWSIPTHPDPDGTPFRVFVSIDPEIARLICVEEAKVTSVNPGARRLEVEPAERRRINITIGEARWLLTSLPKAIAKIEAEWARDEEST